MPWDQTDPPKGREYHPASAAVFRQVFNPFQDGTAPYTSHTHIQEVNAHWVIAGTEQSMDKETGQLHRQPQTPFTARPQEEIQSLLSLTPLPPLKLMTWD